MSFLLISSSCNDEIVKTLQGSFIGLDTQTTSFLYLRSGDFQPVDLGGMVNLIAAPQSNAVNFNFEVVAEQSDAIENLHYTIDSNTGNIPAGEVAGIVPIKINPDNIEQDEMLTLAVRLTSADLELANSDVVVYNIAVTCESELQGTATYTHFDNFTGGTLTGTSTISLKTTTPGIYIVDDFSFGAWGAAYGIDPPTGTLEWTHICGVFNLTGVDNYTDTWMVDEILESDGPNFTYKWSNTYGEFGTVTLVRDDGTNWPKLVL